MRIATLLVSALLLAGCGSFYPGDPLEKKPRFTATLQGETSGWATLRASYSPARRILTWSLDYRGLSGPITWAEFRGPDIEGTDSAIVPINLPLEGNPHPGAATLTDRQAADLEAGRWYVVLKTERFPGGEVRGPVVPSR
ncbi:MAG: CHRD domain-containing protein [Reyranella sp.]|nr:CHRD domain-containing protein [Reyranella sp.]